MGTHVGIHSFFKTENAYGHPQNPVLCFLCFVFLIDMMKLHVHCLLYSFANVEFASYNFRIDTSKTMEESLEPVSIFSNPIFSWKVC